LLLRLLRLLHDQRMSVAEKGGQVKKRREKLCT
jgi:hypothetical protein